MQIQTKVTDLAQTTTPPPVRPAPLEVKPEAEAIADMYDGTRSFGNAVSGAVVGATTETLTSAVQSPRLAWEIAENLWQAETLGPNLKILGTLAAVPAAALSVAVAPFYGLGRGVSAAHHHKHDGDTPLRPDTSAGVAHDLTTRETKGEPVTMTGRMISSLEELGARKLEPGEKPHDVPILSPAFALVGGAVSGVLGGAVGLVSGVVAGAITGGKDVVEAVTSSNMSFGQRAGKVLASPLNLVVGPVLAWKSIKEAVPRGLSDGWKHGLLRPVVDTAKISASLGKSVIQEAWEK